MNKTPTKKLSILGNYEKAKTKKQIFKKQK